MKRRVPAIPPKKPRPRTSVSGYSELRRQRDVRGVCGERDRGRLPQLGHLHEGADRLLDVRDVERLEERERALRRLEPPAHVRVEAQRSRRGRSRPAPRVRGGGRPRPGGRRPCPRTPESRAPPPSARRTRRRRTGDSSSPGRYAKYSLNSTSRSHRSSEQLVERDVLPRAPRCPRGRSRLRRAGSR